MTHAPYLILTGLRGIFGSASHVHLFHTTHRLRHSSLLERGRCKEIAGTCGEAGAGRGFSLHPSSHQAEFSTASAEPSGAMAGSCFAAGTWNACCRRHWMSQCLFVFLQIAESILENGLDAIFVWISPFIRPFSSLLVLF